MLQAKQEIFAILPVKMCHLTELVEDHWSCKRSPDF